MIAFVSIDETCNAEVSFNSTKNSSCIANNTSNMFPYLNVLFLESTNATNNNPALGRISSTIMFYSGTTIPNNFKVIDDQNEYFVAKHINDKNNIGNFNGNNYINITCNDLLCNHNHTIQINKCNNNTYYPTRAPSDV